MVEGGWKEAGIRARCPLSRIRELGSKEAKQVCLGILNGILPGLQTLTFLAYKGIRESNWGSPASFLPSCGDGEQLRASRRLVACAATWWPFGGRFYFSFEGSRDLE